jgi:hypothetical protein
MKLKRSWKGTMRVQHPDSAQHNRQNKPVHAELRFNPYLNLMSLAATR